MDDSSFSSWLKENVRFAIDSKIDKAEHIDGGSIFKTTVKTVGIVFAITVLTIGGYALLKTKVATK